MLAFSLSLSLVLHDAAFTIAREDCRADATVPRAREREASDAERRRRGDGVCACTYLNSIHNLSVTRAPTTRRA